MTEKRTDIIVSEDKSQQLAILENQRELIRKYCGEQRHELLEDIGPITKLALSGDDEIVAGAAQFTVCIWNTHTYDRVDRQVFDFPISAIALSANGERLFVADSNENTLWMVRLGGDSRSKIYTATSPIVVMEMTGNDQCAIGTYDGDVQIIDPELGKSTLSVNCGGWPKRIVTDSDAGVIAVESGDSMLLYRLDNGHKIIRAPDSIPLIVGTFSSVQILDPKTGQCKHEIPAFCSSMAYTRDGSKIVTANRGGAVVWSGQTGKRLCRVHTYVHGPADIKISSNGKYMFICGEDSTIDIYSLAGGRYGTLADTYCPIMAAAQTGNQLVAVDQRGVVALYDLRTGDAQHFAHHDCCVSKMHVLGNLVATGSYDGTAQVLDISSGEVITRIRHRGVPVQAVALDKSGMLVTGTRSGVLRRFDVNDGKRIQSYHGNTGAIRCAAISPCGRYVLSTSDMGDVMVFDYFSGKLLHSRSDISLIYSGCFDDTGDYIFYGNGSGYVIKAHSADGRVIDRWNLHTSNVRSVAMCGKKLVSIGIHDNACVTDPETGITDLNCNVDSLLFRRVAFINEDYTRVVTGGQDGRLRFHDIKDGVILAELHNLDHGFLWTTSNSNDDDKSPRWFWTSRPEMIQVYNRIGDMETLIPPTDDDHIAYMQTNNSKIATMSRVGMCSEAIKRDVAALCQSLKDKLEQDNQKVLLEYTPKKE